MDILKDTTTVERSLIQKAVQSGIPINGSIELLPLCNMNCDMCYVRLSRAEMEDQGKLRTADEWLALAAQMQQAGVLFLLLTGGEPLIYPEFKRLYLALKEMGFVLTINTNGTLLDEEWADFFAAHNPRRINITLYGADEAAYRALCHYSGGFDRTIRAIRLLRERKVDVRVGASEVKANRNDGEKIASIAQELGASFNVDTYMMPSTRERNKPFNEQARLNPEDAARLFVNLQKTSLSSEKFQQMALGTLYTISHTVPGPEEPGRMACLAGRCSFTVNWQGLMRPCVMLPEPGVPVFDVGFEKAWQEIKRYVENIRLSARCSACRLRPVCQTCAACALYESGRYDGVPEYMCRYTIETLNALASALQMENAAVEKKFE